MNQERSRLCARIGSFLLWVGSVAGCMPGFSGETHGDGGSSSPADATTSEAAATIDASDAAQDAAAFSGGSGDAGQSDADGNAVECSPPCGSGQVCSDGGCLCSASSNPDICGTVCTNKQTDGQNCGTCGAVCDGGTVCTGGDCQCVGGTHLCAGACVPNDANACGPSCAPCAAGQGCFAGVCGCISGEGCPAQAGACDTSTHTCSATCDGVTSKFAGGCCLNGAYEAGNMAGACGAGGDVCVVTCPAAGCDILPQWGGGACECGNNDDSFCVGVSTGPRCVPPGAGQECGCLSNADCPSGSCNLVNQTYGYCE